MLEGRWVMNDYVTCSRCGVVRRGHRCEYRTSRKKSGDRQSDAFRNTKVWQRKREEIKIRDRCLCQICLRDRYNAFSFLNYKTVQVHHITSIQEDYNRRLDNDNLICLCAFHHKMAEEGQIPKRELYEIVEEIECGE